MTPCPDTQALQSYLLGAVSAGELEAVSGHLQQCRGCLDRLGGLSDRTSPLVARLRRAALPAPPCPDLDAALARARAWRAAPGRLREYRLLEKLGEGGMGEVYRAVHVRLGKTVAVKLLAGAADGRAAARFEREMKAVGTLCHPHVVAAHDAGEADGRLHLVMEYVPGEDLARLVRRRGPLAVADACEVIRQAALGLQHAHERGLVHRDVKPSNLLLGPGGQVKLLDLGLALLRGEGAESERPGPGQRPDTPTAAALTSASCVMGTRDYMAPEQWQDSHAVGPAADLYSLGCSLYYLLTGRAPFDDGRPATAAEAREAHLRRPPPPLRAACPKAPARLEAVVARLLAKSPADRYPDAHAAAEALRPFAARDLSRLGGARWRWRWLAALAGLVLLGGLGAALWPGRANQPGPAPGGHAADPPGPPPPGTIGLLPEEARALQARWARYLGREVGETNTVGMALVVIPPGELPSYPSGVAVISRPLLMGRYEVTRREFAAFADTGVVTQAERQGTGLYAAMTHDKANSRVGMDISPRAGLSWRQPGYEGPGDDDPVAHVSWYEAEAFCRWLSRKEGRSYRLPSYAEWEWAARAGDSSEAPPELSPRTSPRVRAALAAAPQRAGAVGGTPANAWGLGGMMHNVAEWCQDFAGAAPGGRVVDFVNTTPDPRNQRVVAGRSYATFTLTYVGRGRAQAGHARSDVGFRVVCELPR